MASLSQGSCGNANALQESGACGAASPWDNPTIQRSVWQARADVVEGTDAGDGHARAAQRQGGAGGKPGGDRSAAAADRASDAAMEARDEPERGDENLEEPSGGGMGAGLHDPGGDRGHRAVQERGLPGDVRDAGAAG